MNISIIIPTVQRPLELKQLLTSFVSQTLMPYEIIIIDQSGTSVNRNVVNLFSNLPITIYSVNVRSLTKARNYGVSKATGDVIGFLDDDIVLDTNYIYAISNFFNKHVDAKGVQGIITNFEQGHIQKVGGIPVIYWVYNNVAKFFLLNNSSTQNKLLLSGRNQYASRMTHIIPAEWLSGIGNYKREVFSEFHFDEKLKGYALGEDKLFSYPLFETYPNSLWIDPLIRCEHHYGNDGRPKRKEWVDMKIAYTYHVWNTLLKKRGVIAYAAYWWANIGDIIIVLFSVLLAQYPLLFLWWHIKDYWYILWKKPINI